MINFTYKKLFSILSGNSFVVLSTFIIASILVSKSGLEKYGYFITVQSILISLTVVCKPSTWAAVVRYRGNVNLYDLVILSLSAELLFSVLGGFFVLISSFVFQYSILNFIHENLIIVCLYIFFVNSGSFLGVFRALEKYNVISLVLSVNAFAKIIFAVFCNEDIDRLLLYFVVCDVITWALASLFSLVFTKRMNDFSIEKFDDWSGFFKISFTSSINQILDLPLTQLDRVIVSFIAGDSAAAIFNLLRRLSALLNQIGEPMYQIYFRFFSEKEFIFRGFRFSSMLNFSIKKIGLPIAIILLLYPVAIPYVDIYMFDSELFDYYTTLFLFMLISAISVIFIWINPLYLMHVSQSGTIYITLCSNILYVCSLLIVFNYLTVEMSFICILVQMFFNYALKFIAVRRKVNDLCRLSG